MGKGSSGKQTSDFRHGLKGKPIKIFVGQQEELFIVHSTLLVSESDYFERALKGNWEEAEKGEVRLREDDPTSFSTFAEWLYTRSVNFDATESWSRFHIKVYILADKLQSCNFKAALIRSLLQWSQTENQVPNKEDVKLAFHNTRKGDHLRRLIMDLIFTKGNAHLLKEFMDPGMPNSFVAGLGKAFVEYIRKDAKCSDNSVLIRKEIMSTTVFDI